MGRVRVLVIEDEADALEQVRSSLREGGFEVVCATTGEQGLEASARARPDLVLVDLGLSGMGARSTCRALRSRPRTRRTPILVLAPLGKEAEIVAGLGEGADDYLLKPVEPEIMLARCRVALHRRQAEAAADPAPLQVHELTIDPAGFVARVAGRRLELTVTEFKLLHHLAEHPGRVFTRYQIVDAIRGTDCMVCDRAVDGHIVGLRRKLGPHGRYIETVRGVGYRLWRA
jgi:two-component system alkaline phosphatase synthesis response regulator PhoP